jgi:protein-tyrosine kinase
MGKFAKILERSGIDINWRPLMSRQMHDVLPAEGVPPLHFSQEAWDERFLAVANLSWQAAESFRILRSRILHPHEGQKKVRTIMVTSSAPSEGKSFVSANLGVSIAQGLDQHALLVDCDLRKPTLARLFGLTSESQRGLADYLAETKCELAGLLQKTSVPKLSILPSGTPPVNPAELLASARMSRLVEELSGRYADRFIIFDSPPFQIASESSVLSQAVDGIVLVIGYGKSDRNLVRNMVDSIGREKIIGVVFNGMKSNFLQQKILDAYGYAGAYYGAAKGR